MNFILYCAGTRATGRELAQALGIQGGAEIPAGVRRITNLIRWGNSAPVNVPVDNEINTSQAIGLATQKLTASKELIRKKVRTPTVVGANEIDPNDVKGSLKKLGLAFPILARKATHTRGRDIMLCLQERDIRRALRWGKEYFSQYVPTDNEYRFHVFDGEIIRTSKKVLKNRGEWDKSGYVPWLRNDDHNHIFSTSKAPQAARDEAKKAVAALGLRFGAVDLVMGDDGLPWPLEVNTGPSLIEAGVGIYADKFRSIL